MSAFEQLKRNRGSSLEQLNEQLSKMSGSKSKEKDDRFWKLTRGADGNGQAVIRFLPGNPEKDEPSFIRTFDFGFQGPTGQWYIENSRKSLGSDEADPVEELRYSLYQQKREDDAKKFTRRQNFLSNIYVIKDPANPENEGKVFIFKYRKQIFDKIMGKLKPEFEDEEKINVFDLWDGANFRLRIRNGAQFPTYDKSEFDSKRPLLDNDDELEAVFNSMHSLNSLLAPSNFKTYPELKAKLNKVLGIEEAEAVAARSEMREEKPAETKSSDLDVSSRFREEQPKEQPKTETSSSNDDADELEFFRNLAKE